MAGGVKMGLGFTLKKLCTSLFMLNVEKLKRSRSSYKGREYQFEFVDFGIRQGQNVLDLGSGNHPFPLATHLVDLFHHDNYHRGGEKLIRDARPLFTADISSLPFKNKDFDFVYCSHVLEHVEDPVKACNEIIRVGKRGYIETPTRLSDMIYNFSYLHKWHINCIGNALIFLEYSDRERKGTGTSYFFQQQLNPYDNEIKRLVYKNRDIFCNMFMWENDFNVYVYDGAGRLL